MTDRMREERDHYRDKYHELVEKLEETRRELMQVKTEVAFRRSDNARLTEVLRPFAEEASGIPVDWVHPIPVAPRFLHNAARVLREEGDAISDHDRQLAARVLRWAAYGQTTGSALYPRQMAEAAERLERGDRELEKELGIE